MIVYRCLIKLLNFHILNPVVLEFVIYDIYKFQNINQKRLYQVFIQEI